MLINVRMFHKKAETHNKLLRFAKEKNDQSRFKYKHN